MKEIKTYTLESLAFKKFQDFLRRATRHKTLKATIAGIDGAEEPTRRTIELFVDLSGNPVYGEVVDFAVTVESPYALSDWCVVGRKKIYRMHGKDPYVEIESFFDFRVPWRFRSAGCDCAHCHANVVRNNLFIVHNTKTGELAQVGRNCLKEYGFSQAGINGIVDFCKLSARIAEEYKMLQEEQSNWHDEYNSGSGLKMYESTELELWIATCAAVIKSVGSYIGTRDAEFEGRWYDLKDCQEDEISTFNAAKRRLSRNWTPSDEEREYAREVIAYAKSIEIKGEFNRNFQAKIRELATFQHIPEPKLSCLAFLPASFEKSKEIAKKREEWQKVLDGYADEYAGEVSDKLKNVSVTFANCRKFEGYYGTTYFVEFVDEARHLLIWKTSKGDAAEFSVGDKFVLSATIKAHDEYKGLKQTMITRAKLTKG